jgi:hypothetical protein
MTQTGVIKYKIQKREPFQHAQFITLDSSKVIKYKIKKRGL